MRDKNRRTLAPFLMVIAGALFIAGAVVTGIVFSRNATSSTRSSGGGGFVQVSPDNIPRVSLEEAKAAYDSGEAVFVDVRTADSYAQDHIPGALSMPLNQVEARLAELDPESWIITYCT